jgi:hypothetical protein
MSRGFSFTEILFAIMILGIGFIMVAAMFPVAIHQTETSRQETVGAAIARGGVGYVQQMANVKFRQIPTGDDLCVLRPTIVFPSTVGGTVWDDQDLYNATKPGTMIHLEQALPSAWTATGTTGTYIIQGEVWDFTPVNTNYFGNEPVAAVNGIGVSSPITLSSLLTSMASENMVQAADQKFAWIAFYKRDMIMTVTAGAAAPSFSYAPTAQVIVVATQVRNKSNYTLIPPQAAGQLPLLDLPSVPTTPSTPTQWPGSLQASRSLANAGGGLASIQPPPISGGNPLDTRIAFADPNQNARIGEGAFIIVAANAPAVNLSSPYYGLLNGRIYRLGYFDSNAGAWTFAPGYGPSASDLQVIYANGGVGASRFIVYVVGKGMDPDVNPLNSPNIPPEQVYTGLPQDIAVYSTFISCPPN